jgi:hypothetical protein
VPVQKTYRGNVTRIVNPIDRLVCYAIAGGGFQPRPVWVNNQFEQVPLRVIQPNQLCVPSIKRVLKPTAAG